MDARENGAQQSELLPWLERFRRGAIPARASPCTPTGGRLRVARFNLRSDHTHMHQPSPRVRQQSLPRLQTPLHPAPSKRPNLTVRQIPGVDPASCPPFSGPSFYAQNSAPTAVRPRCQELPQPGQETRGTPPKPGAEALSRCRIPSSHPPPSNRGRKPDSEANSRCSPPRGSPERRTSPAESMQDCYSSAGDGLGRKLEPVGLMIPGERL